MSLISTTYADVTGFEGLYKVSSSGFVISLKKGVWNGKVMWTKEAHTMEGTLDKDGYSIVHLIDRDKNSHRKRVHRLVAEAFIPNPESKPEVNHIDEVKLHNEASNIEWATPKENSTHSNAVEFWIKDPDGNLHHGRNIKDFAHKRGLDATCLTRVINGDRYSHRKWKRALWSECH